MTAPVVVDLRLLPGAGAAWGTAAFAVAGRPSVLWALGIGGAVLGAGALGRELRRELGRELRRGGLRTTSSGPSSIERTGLATARGPSSSGPTRRTVRTRRPPRATGLVIWALLAAAAICLATAAQLDVRRSGMLHELIADGAAVEVRGRVAAEPAAISGGRFRVVLVVDEVRARGGTSSAAAPVLVLGTGSWERVRYGEHLVAAGRLVPTEPGDDVSALLIAHGEPAVHRPPGPVDRAVGRVRSALLEVTSSLPGDAGALVPGVAIGDRSRMPDDLAQAMRAVSLTHVTAVSGAHFSIITATVLMTAAALGLPIWARCVVAAGTMVGFVLLVHPEPSVLRAAAMGAVGVVALVLRRPSRALPALSVSVVVLLVHDPWLARSFGFALSVLATAGLVLLTAPIARRLGRVLPRWAAHAVAVPIAAQLMCAPVIILLDPYVAALAVPANVLAAPALLPATVLGVTAALLAPWWPAAATVLVHCAGAGAWWIGAVARVGAAIPGSRIPWPAGVGGAALLVGVTLVVLGVLAARAGPARRARQAAQERRSAHGWGSGQGPADPPARRVVRVVASVLVVPVLAAAVVLVLRPPGPGGPDPPDGWWLAACDVGQGDALVVRTGAGSAIMVDVGPPGTAAGDCLDGLGVDHLDLLVLTHFHTDHVGGLEAVLADRQVTQVLVSPLALPRAPAEATLATLRQHGVPVQAAYRGSPGGAGRAGDVGWQVLWPEPGAVRASARSGVPESTAANDASVVVLLTGPDLRVIGLGDLETTGQESLARVLSQQQAHRPADVVKVAHHGSARQSPALARLLSAPIALISVGEGNDYGHPTTGALDLYAPHARRLLRTDLCGTIVLTPTDGGVHVTAAC